MIVKSGGSKSSWQLELARWLQSRKQLLSAADFQTVSTLVRIELCPVSYTLFLRLEEFDTRRKEEQNIFFLIHREKWSFVFRHSQIVHAACKRNAKIN